jgi:hypothetical protein
MYLDLNTIFMIIGAPLILCRVRDSDRFLGFTVLKSILDCSLSLLSLYRN